MHVQPASLSFASAEGEEVLEDSSMGNHSADQCHQHGERGDAHNPESELSCMQLVVEIHEMMATQCLAHLGNVSGIHGTAGLRIQLGRRILSLVIEPVDA